MKRWPALRSLLLYAILCILLSALFGGQFVGSSASVSWAAAALSIGASFIVIWRGVRISKIYPSLRLVILLIGLPAILFFGYVAVTGVQFGLRFSQLKSQYNDISIKAYEEQIIYSGDKPIGVKLSLLHDKDIALQRSRIEIAFPHGSAAPQKVSLSNFRDGEGNGALMLSEASMIWEGNSVKSTFYLYPPRSGYTVSENRFCMPTVLDSNAIPLDEVKVTWKIAARYNQSPIDLSHKLKEEVQKHSRLFSDAALLDQLLAGFTPDNEGKVPNHNRCIETSNPEQTCFCR